MAKWDARSQQLDFTRDILANGKHLLSLINDVLDLARVESGTMTFHPERVCLPDLIRETIAGFRLQASERNITLTTDVQMSAIEVFLDPRKLKQVLAQLRFERAQIHASRRPRHRACPLRGRVYLSPGGRGHRHGHRAQDIGRLFQDFHQLGGGLSEEVQGTGLGLALTKRLVEAQGRQSWRGQPNRQGQPFYADLPCSTDWLQSDSKRLRQMTAPDPAAEYSEIEPQAAGASGNSADSHTHPTAAEEAKVVDKVRRELSLTATA